MTRKQKNPSYKPNYITGDTEPRGKWKVFLNGNDQKGVLAANVRRGFVVVVKEPIEIVNGTVKTYKKRGRVKLVRINK